MLELRNVLKTKLNKKGFTLAELLVVVAILAILVAVSIPIFSGKLDKAKAATDEANVRAAKAAAVTKYLQDEDTDGATYYYDAENGVVKGEATGINGYNQDKAETGATNDVRGDADGCIVQVDINADGETVTTAWIAES